MNPELEIVNAVLRAGGEATTVTLSTQHPSVIQARDSVASQNKDFQSRGWWFNRERNIKLLPDNEGKVKVPAETMQFQITQAVLNASNVYDRERYYILGDEVYDNINHTYIIGKALYADLILLRPVERLPQVALSYLKHLCRRATIVDDDGDQQKIDRIEEDKAEAWHRLYAHELKTMAPNALDSPAAQYLRYRIHQSGVPTNPNFPGGRSVVS